MRRCLASKRGTLAQRRREVRIVSQGIPSEAVTPVTRRRGRVRLLLAVLLAWVVILVALLVGWTAYLEHELGAPAQAFNTSEWRAWGDGRWCEPDSPRLLMVEDLQTNHLKLGMKRVAVMRLLGPQDYNWGPNSIEYGLGGSIDCEFLYLDFDRRGRLKLVGQYQG
jgi:hypothetical protein